MKLRKAMEADAGEVIALYQDVIRLLRARGIDQWDEIYPDAKLLRQDIKAGEMYVAGEQGEIEAAFVLNSAYDEEYEAGSWRYPEKRFAVVHRLCVSPRCQSVGLGSQLAGQMELLAKSLGIEVIRLDAFSENPVSLRMYEKLGYQRAGEVRFRKGRFFLYEKNLSGEA